MIACLQHLLGWLVSAVRSRQDPDPRKPRPSAAVARTACSATSPPIHPSSETVLGSVAASLDRMETAAHPGNNQDRGWLASCRVSSVLEMALPSRVDGRAKAGQPRDSGFNLSDGG
jgi:hypothetical protein